MTARRLIDAVILDYGGVMTPPVRESLQTWMRTDGIATESFSRVLRAWLSREAPPDTPIHKLETGDISPHDFETHLAAQLRTEAGGSVDPEGLLHRMFAGLSLDPSMFELVEDLRCCGVRTGLLSNSWGNVYPRAALDRLFDSIVISADVGLRKPLAPIYSMALQRLDVSADRAVFIDDAEANVIGARGVGLNGFVHVNAVATRTVLTHYVPHLIDAPGQRRRRAAETPPSSTRPSRAAAN